MITDNVTEILMRIYSFSNKTDIEIFLEYGKELLERYANGRDIETQIID